MHAGSIPMNDILVERVLHIGLLIRCAPQPLHVRFVVGEQPARVRFQEIATIGLAGAVAAAVVIITF